MIKRHWVGALILLMLGASGRTGSVYGDGSLGAAIAYSPGKLQSQWRYSAGTSSPYIVTAQQTSLNLVEVDALARIPLGSYFSLGLAVGAALDGYNRKYTVNDPAASTLVWGFDYGHTLLGGELTYDTRDLSDRVWTRSAGQNPEGLPGLPVFRVSTTGVHNRVTYNERSATGGWAAGRFNGHVDDSNTYYDVGMTLPLHRRMSLDLAETVYRLDHFENGVFNGVPVVGTDSSSTFQSHSIGLRFFFDFRSDEVDRAWIPTLGPNGQAAFYLGMRSGNDLNFAQYTFSGTSAVSEHVSLNAGVTVGSLTVPPSSFYDKEDWSVLRFNLAAKYAFGDLKEAMPTSGSVKEDAEKSVEN